MIGAFALATPLHVWAFSISTLSEYTFHNSDDWIANSPQLMYLREWKGAGWDYGYCNSVSPFSSYSSWSSMSCWKSRVSLWFYSNLKWQVLRRNASSNDTSSYLFSMSQIKITRNDTNFNIQYYNNISKSWSSIITDNKQQITLTEQNSWTPSVYDKVVFRDDTVIFYNSETLESYQIKAWVDYHNWILLANPYDSDWEDNLWLIKLQEWKAWSTTVSVSRAWDLMIWNEILSNTDIYSLFWDSSTAKYYTISRWGVNPFPFETKWQYNQTNQHIKSTLESEDMFLYSYSNNFQAPNDSSNLPDSNNPSNNPSNYYSSQLINTYNECWNKAENLRKRLTLSFYCSRQDPSVDVDNFLIARSVDNYTWYASNCLSLQAFSKNLMQLYTWERNNWILNDEVWLYDIMTTPFNDLAFAWRFHSAYLNYSGSNASIEWLPSVSSVCAVYNVVNYQENNQSWHEKASETLTDMFWSDVASNYINSIRSWQTFWWLINSIWTWTSSYFTNRFFEPYQTQFYSWMNAFNDVVSLSSCSVIHNSVWTYSRWDIALYGFWAILFLVILTLF